MKKLFSSQDAFELQAVRSELDALSIPYMVKNEFASGAIGELPWQDSQQEVWLVDDTWYTRASKVVEALIGRTSDKADMQSDWRCQQCGEENGGAFELCWQCHAGTRPE